MKRLLTQLTTAAMALALLVGGASAAERRVFDSTDFAAAQAGEKRILIDISAPWCPTCKAQKQIIQSLADLPLNSDLIIYDVDFDSMKDVVRSLGARTQSTLIAFVGAKETARSVGDTDPGSIAVLLASTITP